MENSVSLMDEYEDCSDESRKPEIIEELEEFSDEDAVVDFFIKLITDENEFDLARIEALKIFEIKDYANKSTQRKIAQTIQFVLLESVDDDVRGYAAMAAANYMAFADLEFAVSKIVRDQSENENLRFNAFAAIMRSDSSPMRIALLRELRKDPLFKQSVERLLTKWGQKY